MVTVTPTAVLAATAPILRMGSGDGIPILRCQGHRDRSEGWAPVTAEPAARGPCFPRPPAIGALCELRGVFLLVCRWPSLMKHYSPTDYVNWLEEYKVRQKAGVEARKIVASFSKRFFAEHVSIWPCSSKLVPGSDVCVCLGISSSSLCVCVCLCYLFSMLSQSLPYSEGCKSHCVLLLSNSMQPFVPASFTFFYSQTENEGGRDQRAAQRNVEGIQISLVFLQVG